MLAEIFIAPTGSGSAGGQGSGQQLAISPNHIADCEGVLTQAAGNGPGLVITPTAPERSP